MYFQIHFHGRDWPSLHKFIPPEFLPQEYGGRKPEVDYEKNRQYLYDNEEKIVGKVDYKLIIILWLLVYVSVAEQLVASRIVLSSTQLVSNYIRLCFVFRTVILGICEIVTTEDN